MQHSDHPYSADDTLRAVIADPRAVRT